MSCSSSKPSFNTCMQQSLEVLQRLHAAKKAKKKPLFIDVSIDEESESASDDDLTLSVPDSAVGADAMVVRRSDVRAADTTVLSQSDDNDTRVLAADTFHRCEEASKYGRCLGYHTVESTGFNFPQQKLSNSEFNQTLNESIIKLGPLNWPAHLCKMPEWVVQHYLKNIPQKCTLNGPSFSEAIPGDQKLSRIVNETLAGTSQISDTSHVLRKFNIINKASKLHEARDVFQTRVRIQHSSPLNVSTNEMLSDEGICTLDNWTVVSEDNVIRVTGRNVRTKKTVDTSPIKRSMSPRTVESCTGNIYHLVGSVKNIPKTLPANIANKFSRGFPVGWEKILQDWKRGTINGKTASKTGNIPKIQTRPIRNKALKKYELEQSLIEGSNSDDSDEEPQSSLVKRIYKVNIKKHISDDSEHISDDCTAGTTSTKMKKSGTEQKGVRQVKKWRPICEKPGSVKIKGFLIENSNGKMLSNKQVTILIRRRISACRLEANDGVQYILFGPPCFKDDPTALPMEIQQKFLKGFPHLYERILTEFAETQHKIKQRSSRRTCKNVNSKTEKPKQMERVKKGEQISVDGDTVVLKSKEGPINLLKKNIQGKTVSSKVEPKVMPVPKKSPNKKTVADMPVSTRKRHAPNSTDASKPAKNKKRETKEKEAKTSKEPSKRLVAKSNKSKTPSKPKKQAPPKKIYDKIEISNVLDKPVKTLKHRRQKEEVVKQLEDEYAYTDCDFFASGCSGVSSVDEDSDTIWEADSVSSKLTSDDDRMTYNYTPPLIAQGLPKITTNQAKHDSPFIVKKKDYQAELFVHKQLIKKPKTLLTKKQRDEQRDAAAREAFKQKYKRTNGEQEDAVASTILEKLNEGKLNDPDVQECFKANNPNTDESESECELYFSPNEDEI